MTSSIVDSNFTHDPHSLASSKFAAIGEAAINNTDTLYVSYTITHAK